MRRSTVMTAVDLNYRSKHKSAQRKRSPSSLSTLTRHTSTEQKNSTLLWQEKRIRHLLKWPRMSRKQLRANCGYRKTSHCSLVSSWRYSIHWLYQGRQACRRYMSSWSMIVFKMWQTGMASLSRYRCPLV